MSRTYRNTLRFDYDNLKKLQQNYQDSVESAKARPELFKIYLHECDNFDDWLKAERALAVSDGAHNWFTCYKRGYCGGPPHPTTGKIMGWDDDLPRDRVMHKMTNCVRRRQGKDIIEEGIYEYEHR